MECVELANTIDRVLIILWLLGVVALAAFIGVGIGKSMRRSE